jgi:hypothetical protein
VTVTVKTQTELDKALAANESNVNIDSPAGVWLKLTSTDGSHVEAWGSSRVEARDSSHVEARDSSHVEAWGSSRVEAWGSSSVVAGDSSHVVAWDSSGVVAWGSSSVVASKFVAVHLWSTRVKLDGGVLIDLTKLDLYNLDDFIDYHGVKTDGDELIVYKAVDENWQAGHGYRTTDYLVGTTVEAPDWQATKACGNGLHFCSTPSVAAAYGGRTHLLECRIPKADTVALHDKLKAKSCRVIREVSIHGEAIA